MVKETLHGIQRYQGNGSKFSVEIKTRTITTQQQQQQQQQRESYFKEVEWEEKELKIRLLGTRMGRDRTEN